MTLQASTSDTINILSQSHSIIYGETMDPNSQTTVSLDTIHSLLIDINTKLTAIEGNNAALESRLSQIESDVSKIKSVTDTVASLTSKVNTCENEMKEMKNTISSVEHSAKAMSQIFDDVKKNHESELKSIKTNTRNLEENLKRSVNSIVQKNEELQSSIIDLKSRSMRDNLIFSGIPETPNEDCEAVLHHFLENKLKIDEYISFERVHRMGKPDEFKTKPRNIIAKFSFFKDREFVRRRAPQKLKNTNIWVNEQFPPEIEERRKKLYPVLRLARQKHSHVRLVVDKLYIDGKLYNPEDKAEETLGTQGDAKSDSSVRGSRRENKRARYGSTPDRNGR